MKKGYSDMVTDLKYGLAFGAFVFIVITMWEVQQVLPA
jgi:hypothetical protein